MDLVVQSGHIYYPFSHFLSLIMSSPTIHNEKDILFLPALSLTELGRYKMRQGRGIRGVRLSGIGRGGCHYQGSFLVTSVLFVKTSLFLSLSLLPFLLSQEDE